jgi:hypothetical protein
MRESTVDLYKEIKELGFFEHPTKLWTMGTDYNVSVIGNTGISVTVKGLTVGSVTHYHDFALVAPGGVLSSPVNGYTDDELDRVLTSVKEALINNPPPKTEE